MTDTLEIRLLTPEPVVYLNGEPLTISRSDALDLLVAVGEGKNDDYDRATLSTLLFEDGASSEKLRLAIFHLRKAIGAAYVPQDTQKDARRLRFIRENVQVDTDDFSRRANALLKSTPEYHTQTQFIDDVTAALAVYRTHFLKDYHFVSHAMTEWKAAQQKRLAQLRDQLLGEAVRFMIQQGALTEAQQFAELWYTTSLESSVMPLQHLIWITVSRQRVIETQQHLEKLQQIEDGGARSWGLTAAEWRRRIFEKADLPLSLLDISAAQPAHSVIQLADFIERPALAQQFADLLLNPERLDIIGLVGLPGAGKTSFAQSVLETVRRKNSRKRIAWTDLNNESDLEVLLNDVIAQLGMKQLLPLDYANKQRYFRQMIKAQPSIIVLDEGVSQKFSAPDFLDSVVALFEGTQLILIARELPETRFYVFHVPGLDTPDMRHFLARHLSVGENDILAAENAASFDRLASITGRLPLALALITGAVTGKRYSLPTLLRDMPVERSAWTLADTIRRYDALLDWSWQSLSVEEKTLLSVMSMFDPSGCLIMDVSAVLTMARGISARRVDDLVSRLAHIRLLALSEPENAAQRVSLHPIVYRYIETAPERGDTALPVAALNSAYARYIMAYVEGNLYDDACLDLYRHEIISMFVFSLTAADSPALQHAAVRLFNQVYGYFDRRGLYSAAQRLLDLALKVTDDNSPERVRLLSNIGQSAFKRSAFDEAYDWLTQAKKQADATGDENARSVILRDLGRIAYHRGQYAEAQTLLEQGLVAAEGRHVVAAAQIMANLGMIHREQGHMPEAYAWFTRITQTWAAYPQNASDLTALQDVLQFVSTQLGLAAHDEQDYETADYHLRQALLQARGANNPERIARSYLNLGVLRYSQHDFAAAWDYFTQGNVVADHIQHSELLIWFWWNKGVLKVIAGDHKEAGRLLRLALVKANELNLQNVIPFILIWLGVMYLCQAQFDRARQYFRQVLQLPLSTLYAARALYALALATRYEKDLLLNDDPTTARAQIFEAFAENGVDATALPPLSRKDLETSELYFQVALEELPPLKHFHIIDSIMGWLHST